MVLTLCINDPDLRIVRVDNLLKVRKKWKKKMETGSSRYIYQQELDKGCFLHDLACDD